MLRVNEMKLKKILVLIIILCAPTVSFAGEIDTRAGKCFATINAMLDRKIELTDARANFIKKFVKEYNPKLKSIADKVAVCGDTLTRSCVRKYINENDFDLLLGFFSEADILKNNFYATDPRAPTIPYYAVSWGANCVAFWDKFK